MQIYLSAVLLVFLFRSMDDPEGTILWDIASWCQLVAGLTPDQRSKFHSTKLGCMLQIPPTMLRTILVKYMLEVYDSKSDKFVISERVGEISLTPVDVECLIGLQNSGLCAAAILSEEGEDVKDRVPSIFRSKSTNNITVKDLIAYILKHKAADDDYVRMMVLVLNGTILAPIAKTIPKEYYALVEHVDRIDNINWNQFTLAVLKNAMKTGRKGKQIRQWPKGNLGILQVKSVYEGTD